MSMEVQPFVAYDLSTHRRQIETLLLRLADFFEIRVVWNGETALLTGGGALIGGLLGGYAGGRIGATVGAGIGGVTGFGVSTVISLRQLWAQVKEKLQVVMYLVLNFLRRLDPIDYYRAAELLFDTYNNKKELVLAIISFIAQRLGREVLSSITEN